MKQKKLVFWKHHKIDKSSAGLKKKKEKSQINSIMNEPGNVMTDPIEEQGNTMHINLTT